MPFSSRFSLALALAALVAAIAFAADFARATGYPGDESYRIQSSRPASPLFDASMVSSSSSSLAAEQQRPRRLLLAEKEYVAPPPPARSTTKPPSSASYAPKSIDYGSNFTTSFPSSSRVLTDKAGKHKFEWGVASSAFQSEGGNAKGGRAPSIWDAFIADKFGYADGSPINSFEHWKEDVAVMKALGCKVYRFSISWARMFPDGGRGKINEKAVEFYRGILSALHDAGIKALPTLYHFDLPLALQEEYGEIVGFYFLFRVGGVENSTALSAFLFFFILSSLTKKNLTSTKPNSIPAPLFSTLKGGWTSPKVVDDFGNYASAVFKELGGTGRGKASDFLTMNEPKNAAFLGYAIGVHAPFLKAPATNASQGWTALLHMLEAHAAAVKAYKKAGLKGRIGVALDSEWTLPVDPEKDADAAQRYIDYRLGSFADPLYFGQWPASVRERLRPTGELPPIPRELSEFLVENKPKTFFLNYYTAKYIWEKPGKRCGYGKR